MVQKDLNFFQVLKKGSAKSGSFAGGPLAIIIGLALVIAVAFGVLFFFEVSMKGNIAAIEAQLSRDDILAQQKEFTLINVKNSRLRSYISAVAQAKKKYDALPAVDKALLEKISSSVPAGTRVMSLTVTPPTIQFSCVSADRLAPAVIMKTLEGKGLFENINYTGIAPASGGGYHFTLSCVLAPAKSEGS